MNPEVNPALSDPNNQSPLSDHTELNKLNNKEHYQSNHHHSNTKTFSSAERWQAAKEDVFQGLRDWRIWLLLSWQDIRLRYRRSQIGPFWITLSMAITIYTMGFLYAHLFKIDLRNYFPFLAAGMLSWNLISSMINEGTNIFIEAESYLKQMKLHYTIFVLKTVNRAFIIFFHNILVIVPIIIIFKIKLTWIFLLIFPALMILAINGFFYGMVLAILGARYRDISPIVGSLLQVVFFLTPIMWNRNVLSAKYQWIVAANPFAHFIDLLRAPMIGQIPTLPGVVIVLLITAFGIALASFLLIRVRHRIIYWL